MKTLLLATAVAAALTTPAYSGSRPPTSLNEAPQSLQAAYDGGYLNRADADLPDPWGEEAKEWTCPMPRPTKADGDKDPIYKTELFITYRGTGGSARIATFNVRHTSMSGRTYDRPEQYSGIRVVDSSPRGRTLQTWTGYLAKNPSQQIVGELKSTSSQHSEAHGAVVPVSTIYTERMYKNGALQTTVVAKCPWTGPAC